MPVVHSTEQAGGLAALGLNWQAFLFQLITFVIVLLVLRKFVFGRLVATLEARRQAVEQSLEHAAQTEKKLHSAESDIAALLTAARTNADEIIADSHKEAAKLLEAAEAKAAARAERMAADAKAQLAVEVQKARQALKAETAQLVATATEQMLQQKMTAAQDTALIAKALKQAEGRAHE